MCCPPAARPASPAAANDFLHRSSVISFTKAGLQGVADDVRRLAEKEGLTGHAASVDVRLHDGDAIAVAATSKSSQSNVR